MSMTSRGARSMSDKYKVNKKCQFCHANRVELLVNIEDDKIVDTLGGKIASTKHGHKLYCDGCYLSEYGVWTKEVEATDVCLSDLNWGWRVFLTYAFCCVLLICLIYFASIVKVKVIKHEDKVPCADCPTSHTDGVRQHE